MIIVRVLIALVAVFNIGIGLMFLIDPTAMARAFFIAARSAQGIATLRADFPGFFITGGVFAGIGALRRDRQALLVPIMLLAIALGGRLITLAVDGPTPDSYQPMIAEVAMLMLLNIGYRMFQPRR